MSYSHTTIFCLTILICILSLYLLQKSSNQEYYYFSRRRGGRGRGGFSGGGRGGFSGSRGGSSSRGGFLSGMRGSGSRGSHRGSFGRGGHWRSRGNKIYNNYYGGWGGYGYPYLYDVPAYYYDDYYTNDYASDDWCWTKVTPSEANLSENVTKEEWRKWASSQGMKRILFPKDSKVGNFIMKQSITNCIPIDMNNYDIVIF